MHAESLMLYSGEMFSIQRVGFIILSSAEERILDKNFV